MLLSDYTTQVQELVHDSAFVDYSQAEMTNFINEARVRVSLDTACVRTYYKNMQAIVNQETYPMTGGVGNVQVLYGGSWQSTPSIVIQKPTASGGGQAGVQAACTPVMTGTVPNLTIASVAMTNWGTHYITTPQVTVSGTPTNPFITATVTGTSAGTGNVVALTLATSTAGMLAGDWVNVAGVGGTVEANGNWQIDIAQVGPPGIILLRNSAWFNTWTSGGTVTDGVAVLQAVPMINVVDIYAISYLYGVQRARLQFKPFGVFNTFFRYNTTTSGHPCVWSIYHQQNLFYLFPGLPDQQYPLDIDAIVVTSSLVNTTDYDFQIAAPENDLVQYYAAHKALLKAQNFGQAEYYNNKYNQRKTEILATRYAPRVQNPYQNAWRRIQRGF